jgi:hypothetical protein
MLDKNLQRVKISQVIGNQIPDFIADENPLFVEFLEQYYRSQDSQGGPSDIIENIDTYLKLENFQEENFLTKSTVLTSAVNYYDETINVESTASWPDQYGLLKIDDEIITYTGKTDTSFTGCIRGFSGIENLHETNNQEHLVFAESESNDHNNNSTVLNLSNLFLQEFWKKLKTQFLPGFENREFYPELNKSFFLSRAKDFYQVKGTDESLQLLFKVLYGDNARIIKPQNFIIKPSNAEWSITENIIVERVSGDPTKINGQVLIQDSPSANGYIYDSELYSLDDNDYYLIKLSKNSVIGKFVVNGFTKNTIGVTTTDDKITVDSTLGFDDSGSLYVDGQVITYTNKSSVQFLGCSGISDVIPSYSGIHQNRFAYSYEGGDITKKVVLRITGTIEKFDLETSKAKYLSSGDEIYVKNLGEQIKDSEYNCKFDLWMYNIATNVKLLESPDKFSDNSTPTFVRTKVPHKFRRGDEVVLTSLSGNLEIDGIVIDILYDDDQSRIKNISTRFEFSFSNGVTLDANINYIAKRKVLTASSNTHPEISGVFANVHNTYLDKTKENLYVTSSSLPSYEITALKESKQFSATNTQSDTVTTTTNHNFYTGQKVYLTTSTGSIVGLASETTYFVKRINQTSLQLAYNPTKIMEGDFISYSGIGTHVLTPVEFYNKNLKDQKLLRRFPVTPKSKENKIELKDLTSSKTGGLFVNGVEILSPASNDVVYYGQIDKIDVLNGGKDYDVINPPIVSLQDDYGSGLLANASISGKIESIVVTNPGHDFKSPPIVNITGGNGKNATAEARLRGIQFSINFDGGISGVSTATNTIGFSTYHTFENGDEIIYQSLGNVAIGIGNSSTSTTVDAYLINNSSYYVRKISDTSLQLMNKKNDALSGINTISLNQISTGNNRFFEKKIRKIIDFIQVTNPGEGYENRQIEVNSVSYPPPFPGISTCFVGINTADHYIFAKGHGFNTGEEIIYFTNGSSIGGLNAEKSYYAIKIDDSKFRLADKFVGVSTITGIGTTAYNENLLNNEYIKFSSLGIGTHTFKYPPIQVTISGTINSTELTGISTQASAYPIVKGFVKDIFIKNGGSSYGSQVLNFERQPSVTLQNGSGAILGVRVFDGEISDVFVIEPGSGYVSEPELVINGVGKYAQLKANILNGQIESVQIIDGGRGYVKESTTISIKTLGSGVKFSSEVQRWTVNNYARYSYQSDDGVVIPAYDQNLENQFVSIYTPKKLRRVLNDNLDANLNEVGINTVHSPIIGWAYDGNPIYGPYGGSNQSSALNPKEMQSSYSVLSKPNRPQTSEFSLGFFVEDYEYTESGDLDENNGRFCITPEFPNGCYAYFSTKENYPYIIGSFKNDPDIFNYESKNTQSSDVLLSGNLIRNTTPYRIREIDAYYEGLNSFGKKNEKFVINSIKSSGISSIRVLSGGSEYKVGDRVVFVNEGSGGDGVSAEVESLQGKTITSLTYNKTQLPNVVFSYVGNTVTGITTVPHNLKTNDTILITGISSSSFKSFEGSYKVGVSSVSSSLIVGLGTTAATGIVTAVVLSESPTSARIVADDILTVGSEKLLVLNPLVSTNSYRVLRCYDGSIGSAHTSGDSVYLNPKRFTYEVKNIGTNLAIRENKVTYFNPETSIGFGTTGTKYFIGYGVSFTTIGIQTGTVTKLFFSSHSFSPSDFVQITNGSPSGINTTEVRVISVGSTFATVEYNSSAITGVGNTANVIQRKSNTVAPRSIYIPCLSCGCESIPFQTFEPFTYSSNSGIGISVSEYENLSRSFKLVDGQTIYVTRLSESSDTIGIRTTRTGIGSLSTLYFVGLSNSTGLNTGGGTRHSLTTLNQNVTGTITKLDSTIVTETSHGISTSSTIKLSVVPDRTENVTVKYNSTIDKLIINPVSISPSAIGIGTTRSDITITNHSFKTGDKVLFTTTGTVPTGLQNKNSYYVIKESNDLIKLSKTYAETIKKIPTNISILSTGSGTHEISLINPRIDITRGNNVGFAVSDSTMSNLTLRFYLDPDFINEYSTPKISRSGVAGDITDSATVTLDTDKDTPQILYYATTQSDITNGTLYKSTTDKEVKDFSKIILTDSIYNGEFVVSGVGTTSLSINLSKEPEFTSYTSSNTSTLNYTTKSINSNGPIDKVRLVFSGVGYKNIPKIDSVVSSAGTGAVLRPYSETVGKINSVNSLGVGYNYSADTTIVPKAEVPTLLGIMDNYTLSNIGVSSGGIGYLSAPVPIVLGYPNIILKAKLSGTSVSSVEILSFDGGLSETTPIIVPTQNTNGVLITNAESDGSFNTLTLKRPNNGFISFPFAVGDQIFVEGIETSTVQSQGGGYNSSNYNYSTFEIASFINDENVSSVTYQIPVGLGTTGGTYNPNTSFGRVIKDSDLAKFASRIEQQSFNADEIITASNGASGKVVKDGWNSLTKILKLTKVNGTFVSGSTISGSTSKTKATVDSVESFDSDFIVGSTVEKNNGWQSESGILNNSFQRLQDSFYYQNFSYAIKSKTPYSIWQDPVNALSHTAGFKNFSDLDVTSPANIMNIIPARVSIAASEVGPLIEIDNVSSLYTKYAFDLGGEETISDSLSRYITLKSKKLISFSECVTNKVLTLDDVSPQFTGVTSTTGGNVVGIASFRLLSGGNSVLHKEFNITNGLVIGAGTSIINIPSHEFSTGEKLVYGFGSGSPIGIATTARVLGGISTNLLPSEIYVYKVDDNSIKLSGIKTDATTNGIFFIFRSATGIGSTVVGSGTTHTFSVHPDIANTKAVITIDNIIQSPLFRKNVSTGLSTAIGIGSTTIRLIGITSITSNSLLQIDSEIIKVKVVGFGSTNILSVNRAQFGTVSAAHTVGAAVTVLGGDYTISKGYVYFDTPPYGPVGFTTFNPGISTNSTFSGRVFLRQNYDTNYIFDDISNKFTALPGTGKSFSLFTNQISPTGVSTNNGVILVNNIFQRPIGNDATTDYILSEDGISGITTITFTGNDRETLPRSGIINEVEVGVGTGYTTGSYSYKSLSGGSGSGAKVDVVVGTGGSIISYNIVDRGMGYKQNDILLLSDPSVSGIGSTARFTVRSVYSDKFSGWSFGRLIKIDDFSNQFNGNKKAFTLTRTTGLSPQPFSIESADGSGIELQNNLLVFINDVLQIPVKDYTFPGGTKIFFTDAPKPGSKVKILFYEGSTIDVRTTIPYQTVKVGDQLKLEKNNNIIEQLNRTVVDLTTSDKVETTIYTDVGISTNPEFVRPVTWTKQTSDLIIDGNIISKNRDYLEPRINPTTRLIKNFVPGDTVLYTQGGYPDFRILDETAEPETNIKVLFDNDISFADAIVSTVSTAGTITALTVTVPGSGYEVSPQVSVRYSQQIEEVGKNWTIGITTNINANNLRDIQYQNSLYVVCDDTGGISTSTDLLKWKRSTPTFANNDQLNSSSYGSNVWVGVGSDANVGYSTDNTSSWNGGVIYSYVRETGGLGRYIFSTSSTTRKFYSVAFGNDKFVAVGTGATVLVSDNEYPRTTVWITSTGSILTTNPSGIGTQWLINQNTFVDINNDPTTSVTNDLNSVYYSSHDNRFVSVGNNGVIISSQMGSITNRQFRVDRPASGGHQNLNDIIYAENKYVVVGNNGTVGFSTDLTGPWIVNTLNTTDDLLTVTYKDHVFVASGENGVVANSINGVDWIIKNSVSPTVYSLTTNQSSVIGVGSTSIYLISNFEKSNASITGNVSAAGTISSFTISDGGFGYENASQITVLIDSATAIYEDLDSVEVAGDYGKIIGIGTSAVGIGTTTPMLIFSIQSDVGLNTNKIGGSEGLTPIQRSGITTGDYFVTHNTITGLGVTSIYISSGITTVGIGTTFVDNIYRVDHIVNNGVSGIVTVYCNVRSIVGVASTSVSADNIGFDTTGKVGNYSWGKMYNFNSRTLPKTFRITNNNGFTGIQTSPIVIRRTSLRSQYE